MAAASASHERCLRRLRALSAVALRRDRYKDGAPVLDILHLSTSTSELASIYTRESRHSGQPQSVWLDIGDEHLAGLAALYALALRRSIAADASPEERFAYSCLRGALTRSLHPTCPGGVPGLTPVINCALLRMQSLHCYSRILAHHRAVLESVAAHPDEPAEGHVEGGPEAAAVLDLSREESQAAPEPLQALAALMGVLAEVFILLRALTDFPEDALPNEHAAPRTPLLIGQSESSNLLEHWARSLLAVARFGSQSDKEARLLQCMGQLLDDLRRRRLLPPAYIGGVGTAVVHTPHNMSYMLTSHLVGLAAALDGGHLYGMRLDAAPPLHDPQGRCCRRHASPLVDTMLARMVLTEWAASLRQLRDLLLRDSDMRTPAASIREAAVSQRDRLRRETTELRAIHDRLTKPQPAELAAADGCAGKRPRQRWPYFSESRRLLQRPDYERRLAQVEGLLANPAAVAVPPLKPAATLDISMRLAASAVGALLAAAPPALLEPAACSSSTSASPSSSTPSAPASGSASCSVPLSPPAAEAESAAAPAAAAGTSGGGAGQPAAQMRVRVPPCQLVPLASVALQCAREALWNVGWAAEAVTPPGKLEQLERWWSLAGSFISVMRDADLAYQEWRPLARLLQVRESVIGRELADRSPSSDVAAALRFGYPRLMERMLRGCQAECQPDLLNELQPAWGQLLVFGPAAVDTASLLSTVAKTLRLTGSQLATELDDFQGDLTAHLADVERGESSPLSGLALRQMRCRRVPAEGAARQLVGSRACPVAPELSQLWSWLRGATAATAAETPSEAGSSSSSGGAGTGLSAPTQRDGAGGAEAAGDAEGDPWVLRQLCVGLSHVAVRLLPEVSRLLVQLATCHWEYDGEYDESVLLADVEGLGRCLSWVPLLAAAAAAAAPAAAAGWDQLLWVDMELPALLGVAVYWNGVLYARGWTDMSRKWAAAVRALMHFAPGQLAAALGPEVEVGLAAAADAAPGGTEPPADTEPPPYTLNMQRLRHVLGPDSETPDAEMLAELERLRRNHGYGSGGGSVDAGSADRETTSHGDGGGSGGAAPNPHREPLPETLQPWAAAAALMMPPDEVRAVLPTCANPLCVCMEGDSEAGLRLAGCGRCRGRVQYCSKGCQMAHWKAGHREACAGVGAAAAGGSTAGGSTSGPEQQRT